MTWRAAGMTIGSHTVNHARLTKLSEEDVLRELETSKATIEENLGQVCNHFCSPFCIPGHDYNVARDPGLVRASGYIGPCRQLNAERPVKGPCHTDYVATTPLPIGAIISSAISSVCKN